MKKILRYFPFLLGIILTFLIFHTWFLPGVVTGGDLPYYFPQLMHHVSFLSSWDIRDKGMGSSMLPTLWLQLYTTATLKFFSFLSWNTYVRIVWFFPYLILSILSSYFLGKRYFKNGFFTFLTPLLYVCNTYALLLVGGGQMGIALSYAIAPFGVIAFENFLEKLNLQATIIFSLAFSLIFLLDIRIAYILLVLFGLRFLFELPQLTMGKIGKYLLHIALFGLLTACLHAFWLLPTLLTHGTALQQFGDVYTSSGAVTFFSFAKFEDAFGLLHPNWPENIFGLTHFMQPEFLLLPILAYGSMLFLNLKPKTENLKQIKENTYVLFFVVVGLTGIFLAKGANDPFGGVYLWLFNHIPGFIMFRDPTKWYLLIAMSYSVLIPFTVGKIYVFLAQHDKFQISNVKFQIKSKILNIQNIFVLCFMFYVLCFLIRPALLGQLGGTFKPHAIPQEYTKLQEFLDSQKNFSRTLWVPSVQRFGFSSYTHPAVAAEGFFPTATLSGSLDFLKSHGAEQALQEAAIQYVIVPDDSEGEIFLNDRKYSNQIYEATVKQVASIPWLRGLSGFGKIHVFVVPSPKDHFWLVGQGSASYLYKNPTDYTVEVKNTAKGDVLVFAENYDPFWQVKLDSKTMIQSKIFQNRLNSFVLPKSGTYTFTVVYVVQQWVDIGLWISGISFLLILILLFRLK